MKYTYLTIEAIETMIAELKDQHGLHAAFICDADLQQCLPAEEISCGGNKQNKD